MNETIRFYLKVLLGIGLLVVIFKISNVSLDDILDSFGKINPVDFCLIIIPILIFDRILMSYKWNLLLRKAGINITLYENIKLYMMSSFVGLGLPSTIGTDVIRTYALTKKDHKVSLVLMSVVIERIFGFFAVGFLAIISAVVLSMTMPDLLAISVAIIAVFLLVLVSYILLTNANLHTYLIRILPDNLVGKLDTKLKQLGNALSIYSNSRGILLLFFLLSVLETLVTVVVAVVLSIFLDMNISWHSFLLIVPVSLFIVRIPITFNGIGLAEGIYAFLLIKMGAEKGDALTLGLFMDMIGILMSLSGGIFFILTFLEKKQQKAGR